MSFRFRSARIDISFWFVAVIALLLIIFPESQAVYCFVFCLIHEAGHLAVMLASGKRITGISFGYFGIKITSDRQFLHPLKEALIAAGGPIANFFLAAILFLTGNSQLATVNLGLAFFNLLPVSMLDGGHILSALFSGSKVLKRLSVISISALLVIGIAVAVYSEKNFTVLIVALYLVTGLLTEKD
jgi:Zn-dependent protease